LEYPLAEQPAPKKKRKTRPLWPAVAAWFLVISFWGGLAFAGFYYTQRYIDRSIQSVRETNALQIQALEERVAALAEEMESVEAALRDADKTLASTDSTRQDLDAKIQALDAQLQKLEKSLAVLKEAPDARR